MDTLVAYYSRTGSTAHAAKALARALDADLFEITDGRPRTGIFARLGIKRALRRGVTYPIQPFEGDITRYDLVVVCAPVWYGRLATPAQAFAKEYAARARHIAGLFCKGGPEPLYPACLRDLAACTGQENPVHLFVAGAGAEQLHAVDEYAQKLYRWLGRLTVTLQPRFFSLCTVPASILPPEEIMDADVHIIERTGDTVRLASPMGLIPRGAVCEHNWRLLCVRGPLATAQAGILRSICLLLLQHGIEPVAFSGSGEDATDYLLVRSHKLEEAMDILRRNYYTADNYTNHDTF